MAKAKRKKARSNNISGANTVAGAFRRIKAGKEPLNQLEKEMRHVIRASKDGGVHIGKRAALRGSSSAKMDARLRAKAPGYRISKGGKLYYESRKNRAD